MTATKYLRPKPPARRKKKNQGPLDDLSHFVSRYKMQMAPFCVSLCLGLVAHLMPGLRLAAMVLVVPVLMYLAMVQVSPKRVLRPVEMWYACTCTCAASAWVVYCTWSGTVPNARGWAVLFLGTCAFAAPWWYHRRIRGSIPLVFEDEPDKYDRQARLNEATRLVNEWTAFTSAAKLQGARLQAITYNRWSVTLAIVMRRGAIVEEFSQRRLRILESAFGGVRPGSARVERVDTHARLAIVRFMTDDPHAQPIKPPETGQSDIEKIAIGLFETGEEVLFSLVSTLIAGMSGSGKSGVVNILIRALARIPSVAIVGIDLKPGAPELSKWENVMHALADDPASASVVLDTLLAGMEYRGRVMAQHGWRTWRHSKEQPFIVLIVDEVQRVKAAGLGKKLDRVVEIIRAYGGAVIVATQYPIRENLSKTVKENCPQTIGLRTENPSADRVIFGEQANRQHWSPSGIPRNRAGSLLIRNANYAKPMLARAFWLDDDDVDREAAQWALERTPIDAATWGSLTAVQEHEAITADHGPVVTRLRELPTVDDEGIVDAEIVDEEDPTHRVLQAVRNGIRKPVEIGNRLNMSRATVYRHLKRLLEDDRVFKDGQGAYHARN